MLFSNITKNCLGQEKPNNTRVKKVDKIEMIDCFYFKLNGAKFI